MLDAKELAEITEVRTALEGYAAELASNRMRGDRVELEKHVAVLRKAAKTKDIRRFAEANTLSSIDRRSDRYKHILDLKLVVP
jgi:DNA-binding GntR family transcriptional regulator